MPKETLRVFPLSDIRENLFLAWSPSFSGFVSDTLFSPVPPGQNLFCESRTWNSQFSEETTDTGGEASFVLKHCLFAPNGPMMRGAVHIDGVILDFPGSSPSGSFGHLGVECVMTSPSDFGPRSWYAPAQAKFKRAKSIPRAWPARSWGALTVEALL